MIDKKGKLFGKLNIIDLIVYTVKVPGVEPEVYDFIKTQLPGQLTAADKMLEGYVTKVDATPTEQATFTVKESYVGASTLSVVEKGTYDLVFTIEATVKDPLTSELGTQEIRVGKSHIVKTTTFELEGGVILSCNREDVPKETKP